MEVRHPYDGTLVGSAAMVDAAGVERAVRQALAGGHPLGRHQRFEILDKARIALETRAEQFASLICAESGLCVRETRYEVGRALDVLRFAAIECMKDDGQIFSGDVSPHGQSRKIFTTREPLRLALAITPFNHPLNQVVHKVAPAIAAGTPLILKPSEKTPLTALRFAELLYEAGLPGWMLSAFLCPVKEVLEPLIGDERIEALTFTGSVAIGKRIASIAGYKKLCLELGGNSPLIVLEDADLDLAVRLAAEGAYRNSGQRCTAVKRLLIQRPILDHFTERLVEKTREYVCGNPALGETRVGTVIDEAAAAHLESVVHQAVRQGARVLQGGRRDGALLEPTVIADVPRDATMVVQESFGPLAPILAVEDVDDAIRLANGTAYGLAAGVVTTHLSHALQVIRGLRTGTVNVNQVPGYRIESTPFGGVKDSGLGVKEGVMEALRYMTYVKTWSLPW
ncbi:MAG: aldehyde dehydrogenase family protein [Luteitalea sp.]|nr:aldehyde dehydrogenase family protein [Luteitalea sp.]